MAEGRVIPLVPGRIHHQGYDRCSTINCVRVSLSVDRFLKLSHQVCREVVLDDDNLTLVERCRSNPLLKDIVVAFHLMKEPGVRI